MKKINYGYDISDNPTGAFQGIGIKDKPEGAVTGEFIGIVSVNDDDYLIGRTTEAFGRNPEYIDKIAVRRVMSQNFDDGSGILFIDMEESQITKAIEKVMEEKKVTEESLRNVTNKKYDSLIQEDEITATSIRPDVFDRKKMMEEMKIKIDERSSIYY